MSDQSDFSDKVFKDCYGILMADSPYVTEPFFRTVILNYILEPTEDRRAAITTAIGVNGFRENLRVVDPVDHNKTIFMAPPIVNITFNNLNVNLSQASSAYAEQGRQHQVKNKFDTAVIKNIRPDDKPSKNLIDAWRNIFTHYGLIGSQATVTTSQSANPDSGLEYEF